MTTCDCYDRIREQLLTPEQIQAVVEHHGNIAYLLGYNQATRDALKQTKDNK